MSNLVPTNGRPQRRGVSNTERYMTARFLNHWGTPDCVNVEAFVAEYIRALEGADPAILDAAGNYLIDNHRYPMRWPTVAECRAVVRDIAEEREQRKAALMLPAPEEVVPTPEQRQRGAQLLEQALVHIKAKGDEMVARTSLVSTNPSVTEQRYAESGTALPRGWRDTSRNIFENRYGKIYPEHKSPNLAEAGLLAEAHQDLEDADV